MSSSQQYHQCECLRQINIHMSGVNCGSAVRFGQALPGFLTTAPPPVLVPAVLGALAVWIQNQKTKIIMLVPAVLGTLPVWIPNQEKKKKEERNSNAQHQSSFSETN